METIDIERALKELTTRQKVALLAGDDYAHSSGVHEHGIARLMINDGPNGVRGHHFRGGTKSACLPCGTSLGATFDKSLLYRAGQLMGDEAHSKGVHVVLGPTINIQRSPLGGRGFESFSEDPVLSGLCASSLCRGMQSRGVQTTLKHFVCNDQEEKRLAVDTIVTERALREIYCLPFQLAIRDASPACIMSAYNSVNGTFCSENVHLLKEILREEWGWDGVIMSDFFGTYNTVAPMMAGLDLEMCGPTRFRGDLLVYDVFTDKVRKHVLDARVRQVLKLINKCVPSGIPEDAPDTENGNTPETAALLRRISGEGIVLLKNERGLLPFDKTDKEKKTVVIGPCAKVATYSGGGSAQVPCYYAISAYEGIKNQLGYAPEWAMGAFDHRYLPLLGNHVSSPDGKPGMRVRYFNYPRSRPSSNGPDDQKDRECVDDYNTTDTELLLANYENTKLRSEVWYADLEGSFTAGPKHDEQWEFSLMVSGTAKLFIDDTLLIDNATKQTPGLYFFDMGTVEEKANFTARAGQTYHVRVEFGSAPTSSQLLGENLLIRNGAVRVGGWRIPDDQALLDEAVELARSADRVIVCVGLNADWECESHDRQSMDLPRKVSEMVSAVVAANPEGTVVVNQSGTPVTATPWVSQVAGFVQAWFGGNEGGNAVGDVLFGQVNPSAKLPLSWPLRAQDNPAYLNYHSDSGRVLYGEDVYVGYRFYEKTERKVLFPFGHGLSYTDFELSDLLVTVVGSSQDQDGSSATVKASLTVRNTGKVDGSEVVQFYVVPPKLKGVHLKRPIKELKDYAKVLIGPGASEQVRVDIPIKYAVSYWDEERDAWCGRQGRYTIVAADTSDTATGKTLMASFDVEQTFWWNGL